MVYNFRTETTLFQSSIFLSNELFELDKCNFYTGPVRMIVLQAVAGKTNRAVGGQTVKLSVELSESRGVN